MINHFDVENNEQRKKTKRENVHASYFISTFHKLLIICQGGPQLKNLSLTYWPVVNVHSDFCRWALSKGFVVLHGIRRQNEQ